MTADLRCYKVRWRYPIGWQQGEPLMVFEETTFRTMAYDARDAITQTKIEAIAGSNRLVDYNGNRVDPTCIQVAPCSPADREKES